MGDDPPHRADAVGLKEHVPGGGGKPVAERAGEKYAGAAKFKS